MKLEYNIFFAKLTVYAPCRRYTIKASSGILDCMNQPSCVNIRDKGPIPFGIYWIHPKDISKANVARRSIHILRELSKKTDEYLQKKNIESINFIEGGDWGDWRIKLYPDHSTNTFGRDGFFIHGGSRKGSKGCIDIGGGAFGNKDTDKLYEDIVKEKFKIKLTVKKK